MRLPLVPSRCIGLETIPYFMKIISFMHPSKTQTLKPKSFHLNSITFRQFNKRWLGLRYNYFSTRARWRTRILGYSCRSLLYDVVLHTRISRWYFYILVPSVWRTNRRLQSETAAWMSSCSTAPTNNKCHNFFSFLFFFTSILVSHLALPSPIFETIQKWEITCD